ncbi:MAG: hypothetical protein AAGK67_17350, partial [Pseudomonadota bacterium]
FQPSLILQLRDKTIPVGGPLSGGYSNCDIFWRIFTAGTFAGYSTSERRTKIQRENEKKTSGQVKLSNGRWNDIS